MPATYTQFRDDLLMALARKTNRDGREVFDYDEIADEAGLSRNRAWVEMAAFELRDLGYVNDASSLSGYGGFLSGPGMLEAERLIGVAERTAELDHSGADYQKAASALGAVTDAVRQSNEYASSEPEDRDQRLAELEAGSRLLKAARVRISALATVLLPVLIYLADHFTGAVIGDLASQAVAALKRLFDELHLF